MKWYLIIGAAVIIVATFVFFFFFGSTPAPTPVQPTPTLPIAGSATSSPDGFGTTPLATGKTSMGVQGGGTLVVTDFIHNGETIADTVNPGLYVLAGDLGYCLADGSCPTAASTSDFKVSYNSKTNFFTIVLLKEPLGAVRLAAEQFVSSRLSIVGQQACGLHYSIGAPYWVNTLYDSKNLGFSFCPGATVLPQ